MPPSTRWARRGSEMAMTPRRFRPRTGPSSSKASYHDFSEEERLRAALAEKEAELTREGKRGDRREKEMAEQRDLAYQQCDDLCAQLAQAEQRLDLAIDSFNRVDDRRKYAEQRVRALEGIVDAARVLVHKKFDMWQ